ncbi:MAG: hypothetical protein Q9170_007073 [Blastenia crenularia]
MDITIGKYLLLGAAVSMGAVAIWSMHYIGNRAIIMAHGQHQLQIQYNAAYTAGSFFLPIVVLGIAFYLLGLSEKVKILRIIIVGSLTGSAICGMHYFGQGGISNYIVSYNWEYVLGSACIAVSAATVALGVFFYLKTTWTNNWWRRGLCAAILAAAVSGMHWVASVGTIYRYRRGARRGNGLTRQGTVVIVLCFALLSCLALIGFAVFGQRRKNRSAHHAQQVVLATVIFDTEGKLMVTPDGTLPSRKIAKTAMERNFDETFETDHPVFAWMYRASHYWPGVTDLIPGMKAHLESIKHKSKTLPGLANMLPDQMALNTLEEEADFDTKFKELFCVAASELADSIQQPLEGMGGLFESIMLTGTIDKPRKLKLFSKTIASDGLSRLEYGQALTSFGRGQLLFLVQQASRRDAARLQAAGFNFATLTYIMPSLAQSLEVTTGELSMQLHQIQRSLRSTSMLEPGVHLACFALRPKFQRGWTVLINKDKKNLLPSVHLMDDDLKPWQTEILLEFDGMTARECLLYIEQRLCRADARTDFEEADFLHLIKKAIGTLYTQINHPLFEDAQFFAHSYMIPCQTTQGSQSRRKAAVMMFRVIADAHYSSPLHGLFEFGSARLFRAQQHVYPRSPGHAAFTRQVHLEFAGLAEAKAGIEVTSSATSGHSTPRRPSGSSKASSRVNSLVKHGEPLMPPFPPLPPLPTLPPLRPSRNRMGIARFGPGKRKVHQSHMARPFFGGIHVQRSVSVDITEIDEHHENEDENDMEMNNLGVHNEVTVAPTEIDTFADELMYLLVEERRQQTLRVRTM